MTVEISEDSEAKERFVSLHADVPDGVSVIPAGQEEIDGKRYIVYPDGTDTVRKLLKQNGVDYTPSNLEDDTSTLVLRSEEIILPTLYLAYRSVKENWDQIEFALNKIAEFYRDQYTQNIEMTIEQEMEDGSTTRVEYRGPPDGIQELPAEIAALVEVEDDDE